MATLRSRRAASPAGKPPSRKRIVRLRASDDLVTGLLREKVRLIFYNFRATSVPFKQKTPEWLKKTILKKYFWYVTTRREFWAKLRLELGILDFVGEPDFQFFDATMTKVKIQKFVRN